MSHYVAAVKPIKGHQVPKLLMEFGSWLSQQEHPSLGYMDALNTGTIPLTWSPGAGKRLRRDGFVFGQLPDGSLLSLITPPAPKGKQAQVPAAVVLLGSEGEAKVVADSFEGFLIALAQGDTGIDELDDDDADGRAAGGKALRAWLKQRRVRAAKATPFDLVAYLDETPAASRAPSTAPPAAMSAKPTRAIAELSPFVGALAMLVGRRADDPELVRFIAKRLGKKTPTSTSVGDKTGYVVAPNHGIEMCFSHDTSLDRYPPIAHGRAFIPYLSVIWLKHSLQEPLPYGLALKQIDNGYGKLVWRLDEDVAKRVLGKPTATSNRLDRKSPVWMKPLDPDRSVWFKAEFFGGLTLTLSDGKAERA